MPPTQNPDAHSADVAQAAPSGLRTAQRPARQMLPAAQSLSTAQVVRQALATQVNGWHDTGVPAVQLPAPLHVGAGINVVPLQLAAAQTVPAARFRHIPAEPGRLHALQAPHIDEQQTPSTQNPEPHSADVAHVVPSGLRAAQRPATQTLPAAQSLSTAQVVRQALAAQVNGWHDTDVPAAQLPAPLHVRASVSVAPLQLAAAQTVPAARFRHIPAEPGRLHALQAPHTDEQQTPSTQNPEPQPADVAHAVPLARPTRAVHSMAASTRARPLLVSTDAAASPRNSDARRSGAVMPTIGCPFS
jgi:hypothetical protein